MSTELPHRLIKCVVWDLDNTLWDGVLLEDPAVGLRPGVANSLRGLDERGILQSIASRNEPDLALARLRELEIDEYFLHPQIHWDVKSKSIQHIAERLSIGTDAIALIDDEPIERDEVLSRHPSVLCLDASLASDLCSMPGLGPPVQTKDARQRRQMMRANMARESAETSFDGPAEAFLSSLEMVLTIRPAQPSDLRRIQELTLRANRLTSIGRAYDYEEIVRLHTSQEHLVLVARLVDRYGSYGTIGVAVIECGRRSWTLELLLTSCRVMQRGVAAVLLGDVMRRAASAGAMVQAYFVPTAANRMMLVTYRLSGFRVVDKCGGHLVLKSSRTDIPAPSQHMRVISE